MRYYSLHPSLRRRRFRAVPVRTVVPNVITLLALCAGLTAIRLAAEGTFDWAVFAIVAAAVLDGVDGRVARLLKGTSRFGAELDSLADFVNFGVAPAMTLYFWSLHEMAALGWIAALAFTIAGGLRLARFNVTSDDPARPSWAARFFTGVPAPAGAIMVLLPLFLNRLGFPAPAFAVPLTVAYVLAVAFLMVSRLPVYSGKNVGQRVPPDILLPVIVAVVLGFALLIAYPWPVLAMLALLCLASLPFSYVAYRDYLRRDAEEARLRDRQRMAAPEEPPLEEDGSPSDGHGAVLPFDRGGDRPAGR
jgi:CDP-diacylglycerol--serine O-phosphatidyltransferase